MPINCKNIQGLILTDYIDTRMGDKQKCFIDQHLSHCHACEEFLIGLKKEIIGPFNNAQKVVPDESLWVKIKGAIEEEQRQKIEKSLVPDFWERLRASVHVPRPAFALATIVTMIFMVGTTGQLFINNMFVNVNGQDQVAYLSSLMDEPADPASDKGNEQQTPIEKYFL